MSMQRTIKVHGFMITAIGAALLGGLTPTPMAGAVTIGGHTYVSGAATETLNAPFASVTGVTTANQYSGYVLVNVTGTGQAQGTSFNDAFYGYTDGAGNPIPPAHDASFYQLRYSNAPMAQLQPQFDAYQFIVYDGNAGTSVTPPYTPAYQSGHAYTFAVPVPGNALTHLYFGVSDGNFTDNTGSYSITVTQLVAQPVITKSFTPALIVPGGTTALGFTINNPDPANPLTNVGFTDTLQTGLTVATPAGLTGSCGGGTITATPGSGTVSLAGATLAANTSCTFSVNVTAPEGQYSNTVTAAATGAGVSLTSAPSTAALSVVATPVISKSFGEVSIGPNNTVGLTFSVRNPNGNTTLTGIAFTDALPAGLKVSNPSSVAGVCDSGTITAVAGSNSINLAGASLAAGVSCTFTVNVTADGTATGLLTNTTGAITSTNSLTGNVATASIFIGDPFQVTYASNLSVGDSVINITNSGASGAALQSGTTANITGAICANVYAFTPDEQLVSCCSCPVTPNGLVSLSAKNDLASNTLTPAVPTALVVKVVATLPVAGSCTNSAAAVNSGTLANGLKSYGSTIHATPTAGSYGVTETPFSPATLSTGELSRVGSLCNFILANGSGFGVCRSCRLGGLGADRQ